MIGESRVPTWWEWRGNISLLVFSPAPPFPNNADQLPSASHNSRVLLGKKPPRVRESAVFVRKKNLENGGKTETCETGCYESEVCSHV